MRVTIITVTFNSAKTIERTTNSVASQTYKDIEHIIVDNNSIDRTTEIVRSIHAFVPNIKSTIIKENDEGISDAFNKGIKAAIGDIILLLHSDDYLCNDSVVEKVVKIFKQERPDFTHGNILFVDETFGTNVRSPIMKPLTYGMPYNHPGMFVKKEVYEKIGLFNTGFKLAMDFELICRMYEDSTKCKLKTRYIGGEPLVTMMAGGASWLQERTTLEEVKRALEIHNLWDLDSALNYTLRVIRLNIKNVLNFLNLQSIVKIWRNKKWN